MVNLHTLPSAPVWAFMLLTVGIVSHWHCKKPAPATAALFTALPATHTGIDFINTVKNTKDFNILTYRNFYNGGGVAIGDINNDGLADVFFTANMGDNKLYVNKGKFQFEDISQQAGITATDYWSTGVVMVDINQDSLLDIYVCNAGYKSGQLPRNQLYINNGNLTFTEKAADYGLADEGYTTHAAFFDYDGDKDLDCYILNNSFIPVNTLNYENKRTLRAKDWPVADFLKGGGDKLLRNDNGNFTDVSEKAGIYGSLIGFGLGVTVGDINQDGWLDIYVANDFFERDYLYINQKNGTYKEQLTDKIDHLSLASMGSDLADINNDGLPDIFATEMLPYDEHRLKTTTDFENIDLFNNKLRRDFYPQFTQNTLQLNQGNGSFAEVAHYAGVAASDWSWGALIFDADMDGWQDLLVCNGIYHDVIDQDFIDYFADDIVRKMALTGKKEQVEAIIDKMPSVPIRNLFFKNKGDVRFEEQSAAWGLSEKTFSNGAAYGDLDNDGDLDLVINNVNQPALVYKNNVTTPPTHLFQYQLVGERPNLQAIGSKIVIYTPIGQYARELIPARGFQSSMDYKLPIPVPKTERIDSIIVYWYDHTQSSLPTQPTPRLQRIEYRQVAKEPTAYLAKATTTLFTQQPFTAIAKHQEDDYIDFYVERNVPAMLSKEGGSFAIADVNKDGKPDIYATAAKGQPKQLYLSKGKGYTIEATSFAGFTDYEDTAATFFDADGDGDADLWVGSGGNHVPLDDPHLRDRLYINNGNGKFAYAPNAIPPVGYNTAVIRPHDVDGDGDLDVLVGNRSLPHLYGASPNSYLFYNDGKGSFTNVTPQVAPALNELGMLTDAQWVNVDADTAAELLIVGEWMSPKIIDFKNNKGALLSTPALDTLSGFWYSIGVADFDGNGTQDFIIGNSGENNYLAARNAPPLKLWLQDFDDNKNIEKIITYQVNGRDVPVLMKRELVKEIPSLKKKILHHHQYADKSLQELFEPKKWKGALQKQVNTFQTYIVYTHPAEKWKIMPLPTPLQWSAVTAICPTDLNGDGKMDILIGGNKTVFQPQYGSNDASKGWAVLNKGNQTWEIVPPAKAGLHLKGMVRHIAPFSYQGKAGYLVGINDAMPLWLELRQK